MYAVIITGGKQYKVANGTILRVEKLVAAEGESVEFDKVLMLVDGEKVTVGKPYIDNAKVTASVVSQARAKKIRIIKMKRRKHHRKTQGHRQHYTEIKVTGIAA